MMQTEIITITDVKAQQADLARAGKVLRSGGLVAFPTETVYGLGANGLDADADGIEAARDAVRHDGLAVQDQSDGARHKGRKQFLRHRRDLRRHHLDHRAV